MTKFLSVSAPGRVCLFGEHQDYLGLYVIPCAISLRTYISGKVVKKKRINVTSYVDGKKIKDYFYTTERPAYQGKELDYLRAVVNIMLDDGYCIGGLDCCIKSKIPIKSGLSSSAALLVAWTKFLAKAFNISLNQRQIATIAYRAEHDELKIPCGQMDQFSSSLGGIFFMECSKKPKIEKLQPKISKLIVVDTGVKKGTVNVHSKRVSEINLAIKKLSKYIEVDLKKIKYEQILPYLNKIPKISAKRLVGSILNRDLTLLAKKEFKKTGLDEIRIGELLNLQQKYLRDYIEVSIPQIEKIIRVSMKAGSLGGKLTGAGMGGSVIIYAPNKEIEVINRLSKLGFKSYIVNIDTGVRVEKKFG